MTAQKHIRSAFFAILAITSPALAFSQINLVGTNYTQNFDDISGGLPFGWTVSTNATATTLGESAAFSLDQATWASPSAAFRNISSYNISFGADSTAQGNNSNRALGWRPIGSNAGEVSPIRNGAVTLKIANTLGFESLTLSLDVFQTFNTSGIQTYKLEYRIGETGFFTQIGADYLTKDSGAAFTDYNLTQLTSVSLSALANQSSAIYIRLRGVSTSGSTNLDTIALDNFSLSYSQISAVPEPAAYPLLAGAAALGFIALRRSRRGRPQSANDHPLAG